MLTNATLSTILTRIASQTFQSNKDFGGPALFPAQRIEWSETSAGYFIADPAQMLSAAPSLSHVPGGVFGRSKTILKTDNFSLDPRGHEEPVGRNENQKYARPGAALEVASRRLSRLHLLNHEQNGFALAASASVPSAQVAVSWRDPASDPLGDVNVARQAVFSASGMDCNVAVIPRLVYETLKLHPAIRALIKMPAADGAGWQIALARLFDVEKLVVARSAVNTAAEGQALVVSEIWGQNVILAFVDYTGTFEMPSFGRLFYAPPEEIERTTKAPGEDPVGVPKELQGERPQKRSAATDENIVSVELYDDVGSSAVIVRAFQNAIEKITAPACAYRLFGTLR